MQKTTEIGHVQKEESHGATAILAGWSMSWYVFAAYAAVVTVLFAFLFRYKTETEA